MEKLNNCEECSGKELCSNFMLCTYCESKMCLSCYKRHLCPQSLEDFVNYCYENNLCINDARKIINQHIEKVRRN